MKIKSLIDFAGIPKGSTGDAVRDEKLWKITWDKFGTFRGIPFKKKPLEDWFDEYEFKKYLVVI